MLEETSYAVFAGHVVITFSFSEPMLVDHLSNYVEL